MTDLTEWQGGSVDPALPRPLVPPLGLVTAKILIVDDDPKNLLAVEEMLRAPGLEIVTAQSGEAALRCVLRDDFAVILLDVQLPSMDGYEVATLIRGRPKTSRVPIIFLTAYNKEDLHVFRGYTAGAVDYVFKPIEPIILKSKVNVFVDLFRKTEEIRRQGEEERRLLMENLRVRSEKLRAEQDLRRREEHQSIVLRSLPVALYTAGLGNDRRKLRFTNPKIKDITGFSPAAFFEDESFWESRLHPDDRERVLGQLASAEQDDSLAIEYRWRCADDVDRHFLDQTVLIRDESGRPREYFGLWFDVSERKQLEQKLLHASKLEAVGRLTGGIAHDFNNMLSVVIGNLDLLQRSIEGNEKALRRTRLAMDGAQRCADLTHRLLAFSRRQPLQATVLDLKALMPGLLELMQRTLGERIRVQLESSDDLWPVRVDRVQLEAGLINLAVNARDAMTEGGDLQIRLENKVFPEAEDPGGECVMISVTDTGEGMSPEVKQRVFEPFFTTKESGKGTGLGLSMVYGFIQQSGGRVELESAPGQGTTIRLILPRAVGEVDRAMEPVADVAEPFGQGRKVLVVEDDPAVRQVAVSTLKSLGFQVQEAETGDDAARLLQRDGEILLVLSDVRMPGDMTGIDLARLVRQERPSVRVLLTTGYVEGDSTVDDVDLLYKPYRANDLAEKIQSLLRAA
ncbi:response regulator [Microvirga massiliensis]|uniref:response regulator n=1 Tax=Microvirga massiliensis TaxID=1033741 RepID=UPI00062B6ACD|nr:response regulator [Microvirga massiliensis]